MTRFEGGPANGKNLMLKRIPAPLFLRVTEKAGKFDALDQLTDEPEPGETLYVYRREGEPSWCHLNIAGGRGGFFQMATYRFVEQQPDQATLLETDLWRAWTVANGKPQ